MIRNIRKNINSITSLKFIRHSVKSSLFLLVFLTMISTTFSGTYLNLKWKEQSQKQDLDNTEKTSILISQSYHQILRSTDEMLTLLKKSLSNSSSQKINISQILNDFLKFNRRFHKILIMNEKGRIIFSSHKIALPHFPDLRESMMKALNSQEMIITDMYKWENEAVVFFIFPIFMGKNSCVIVAPMSLNIIHSLATKVLLPKTCTLALTDRQGNILGHNTLDGELKITGLYPNKEILQKILKKNYGVFEQESRSGKKILYYFLPIHLSKGAWSLIISYSKESLFETTNQLFKENFNLFWISFVLLLLMSWIISYRFISRPLKNLLLMVNSLEKGQLQPPYNFKGEFATVANSFKEMTRKLDARRDSLEKSYHWFSNMIDLAGEAILSFDKEGVIHFGNKTAHQIFGRPKETLKGQCIFQFLQEDSHIPFQNMLLKFNLSPDDSILIEDSLTGLNTTKGPFSISATLSQLIMEETTLYVAIIRDITLRKQQEEVQSRYNSELERSNSDLEEFAYTASHDLQEPLRMITMYLELLQERYKNKLEGEGQEFIGFAVDGAHRMQAMIKALLSYARAGRLSQSGELIETQAIVCDVLRDLKLSIEESKAKIDIQFLPPVWADKVEMKQIFLNIIGNALKFRKDAPPSIQIWGELQNEKAIFYVKDNGIGFDPRFSDRIFGLFQRLHSRESYKGTGIGLALVKKIIQRRGGTIQVNSSPGRGTTFIFSLPSQSPLTGDQRSVA